MVIAGHGPTLRAAVAQDPARFDRIAILRDTEDPVMQAARDGRLPLNTSGGGLSNAHPGMLGLYLLISKTRLGMKIRAGAFNHEMTEALGVNVKLIHAVVFALGVGLATIAGMIASPISSVYPNMGSQVLIMCFVVVVIGGIGSVRGALISALLVGTVDTFGKVLLPQVAGMLVYMLMAAVLLWKPEGLFKQ